MKHNRWIVACVGCLVACVVFGDREILWATFASIACAGGCFWKWLVEDDKHLRREFEDYMKSLERSTDFEKYLESFEYPIDKSPFV